MDPLTDDTQVDDVKEAEETPETAEEVADAETEETVKPAEEVADAETEE